MIFPCPPLPRDHHDPSPPAQPTDAERSSPSSFRGSPPRRTRPTALPQTPPPRPTPALTGSKQAATTRNPARRRSAFGHNTNARHRTDPSTPAETPVSTATRPRHRPRPPAHNTVAPTVHTDHAIRRSRLTNTRCRCQRSDLGLLRENGSLRGNTSGRWQERAGQAPACIRLHRGKETSTDVPSPALLRTVSSPPIASAKPFASGNPSPTP